MSSTIRLGPIALASLYTFALASPANAQLLQHKDLSADMALRLEMAFGVDMDHLLRMQVAYDVAQTRRRKDVDVKRYVPA